MPKNITRSTMHPDKRLLDDFIRAHLPALLRKHNGVMKKEDAHQIIHRKFRRKFGWPSYLDELEGRGPVWTNAWGWALRHLSEAGITRPCTRADCYELQVGIAQYASFRPGEKGMSKCVTKTEQSCLSDEDRLKQDELLQLEALGGLAKLRRLSGKEEISYKGDSLGLSVMDFWRWGRSDLVTNTERGVFAEFLVAIALDVGLTTSVRDVWGPVDLTTPEGISVQVRSAAYVQSWSQKRFSAVKFDIKPKMGWELATNTWKETGRHAEVYVFALLKYKDKASIDPLRLEQWGFYVLPTACLVNCHCQHISLNELQNRSTELRHCDLRKAVLDVGQRTTQTSLAIIGQAR